MKVSIKLLTTKQTRIIFVSRLEALLIDRRSGKVIRKLESDGIGNVYL